MKAEVCEKRVLRGSFGCRRGNNRRIEKIA
jgi:hypothetical protein